MPDSHRTEADVDIGKRNPEEARPSPFLVPRVQVAHEVVDLVPYGVIRDLIECAANHVPKCVTPENIPTKKHYIYDENEASNPYPESIRKKERSQRVVNQEAPDNV